jgi:DNA-binding NtrC family response regulator
MTYCEEIKNNILLINDDSLTTKSLFEFLSRNGYDVETAKNSKEAYALVDKKDFPVILTDLNGTFSTNIIKSLKKLSNLSNIIVLASYANVKEAVESIKLGAFDYLVRPVEDDDILECVKKASDNLPNTIRPKKEHKKDDAYSSIIAKCRNMMDIFSMVERIADSRATVLIKGESGTGKRLIAHAIHKKDQKRKNKPFIEVSCGALPREIIESELFGHTKGAFTGAINDRKGRFELANGGTIMLDDIDSLSLDLQVKLLRVLQQKEFEKVGDNKTLKVDIRIIATTNQDLEKLVKENKFREDLYYRLNVINIDMPALRDRKEDLPALIEHFIKLYSEENHKQVKTVSDNLTEILSGYDWPGNIRQLENIIERAVILDTDGMIGEDDLPELLLEKRQIPKREIKGIEISDAESLKDALKEPEKIYILKVLQQVGWNKKKAAVKLGVNRTTLYSKIQQYNLLSSIPK